VVALVVLSGVTFWLKTNEDALAIERDPPAETTAKPSVPASTEPPPPSPKTTTLVGDPPPMATAPFVAKQAKAHQVAWAYHLGTQVEIENSVGMKMVVIPAGEFMMGSSDEEIDEALLQAKKIKTGEEITRAIQNSERPQHKVIITKPFLMGATEVTIGQFKKFVADAKHVTEAEKAIAVGAAPASKSTRTYLNPGFEVTDDYPAGVITWNDAVAFCKWLSVQEKKTYRLPTEAEWEFACRAGTTTQYSFGDDYKQARKYFWFNGISGHHARPVGQLLPNPFGLYDMHGNMLEWCADWHDGKWYEKSPSSDPLCTREDVGRVIRGGFYDYPEPSCRSAFRHRHSPSSLTSYDGFRCVAEW
jgi:formylglycine-generating enzyme required for sulfatase activity